MSAEVMFNRETHKSRGFGFIVFELERGAEQVCAEREHVIDGKVVRCCELTSPPLPIIYSIGFQHYHTLHFPPHCSFSLLRLTG
jgi:RNA recognition motif. (a.k.a. RRM, RBD, or RNP domain)